MQRIIGILSIAIATLMISCTDNRDVEASTYLAQARILYAHQQLDEARAMLDSLPIKFPLAYNAKAAADILGDSIVRDQHRIEIDEINEQINNLKISLLKLSPENDIIRQQQLQRMDSLNQLKKPLRNMINIIGNKEVSRAACTQCITSMQNAKNR